MAKKNSKAAENLSKSKPFKPGADPRRNMDGRPKKDMCISDALRDILAGQEVSVSFTVNGKTKVLSVTSDKNMGYGIAAIILSEAMKGDVRAFNAICDRVQGKPMQPLGVTTEPITLVVSDEFLPDLDGE